MADVTHEATTARLARATPRVARRGRVLVWLPVAPFFLYITVFLLLPAAWLVVGAFQTEAGRFTLDNTRALFNDQYGHAYLNSIALSATTALTGTVCGFFVAYAAIREGAPRWVRPVLSTFAGVAANFAGIPLAFAFVATLGTTGIVTALLDAHGVHLYQSGFTLYSFGGLTLVYTYFQLPLMLLVISPALDGLRREWYEAATCATARASFPLSCSGCRRSCAWRWICHPSTPRCW